MMRDAQILRTADLFAGIGGIRLGFEQASSGHVECVFVSEWDKYAARTYQANFPDAKIQGDITDIDAEEIPDHDILFAGFPCQPFSQAGLKLGFEETRGTLFFDIERILLGKQPRAFLLENVRHLVTHHKGRTFGTILRHLSMAGYRVYYDILKAKDFGLPQNRERVYIVGFLDHSTLFHFPESTKQSTRLGDILEERVDDRYTISDGLWAGHRRRKDYFKKVGYGFGYVLYNRDSEYTQTLSARYYKDGSEILVDQGPSKNPRMLTPRECARLQGFPDSFVIPVSDTQAYRQFGNSVAVPVVRAIATNMLSALQGPADPATTGCKQRGLAGRPFQLSLTE